MTVKEKEMKTSQIYPVPATEVNNMEGTGSASANFTLVAGAGRGHKRSDDRRDLLALFPVPARRTGQAVFPHPALGKDTR